MKIKKLETFLEIKLNKDNSRFFEPNPNESYVFVKQRLSNGSFYETNEIVCYDLNSNNFEPLSVLHYSNFKNYIKTRSVFIEKIIICDTKYLDKGFDSFSLYFLIELASTTFKQNILVLPMCFASQKTNKLELFYLGHGFHIVEINKDNTSVMEYLISKNSILRINSIRKSTLEYTFYTKLIQ